MDKQISKQKLLEYLQSAKVVAHDNDNPARYMYCLGRNMLADVVIASVRMGDFDE